MPIARFQMPDGRVARFEVPDGTTPEQAQAVFDGFLRDQQSAGKDAASQMVSGASPDGGFKGSVAGGFLRGAKDLWDGGAQMLERALPEGARNTLNELNNAVADKTGLVSKLPQGGVTEQVKRDIADYEQARALAGREGFDFARLSGNVAAGMAVPGAKAASLPRTIAGKVGAGALVGAGANALMPVTEDGEFWEQKGAQAATGAVAGAASVPIAAGLSRIIKPNTSPEVKRLMDAGVTPTPGQILGGGFQRAEDKAMSIPILGDLIASSRKQGLADFQKAAYARALDPIGGQVPKEVGQSGMAAVREQLNSAYEKLLPKVVFQADNQFSQDVTNVLNMARSSLPDAEAAQLEKILKTQLFDRMTASGRMSGDSLKIVQSEIGRVARGYRGDSSYDKRQISAALDEVMSSIRKTLIRSNPQMADELSNIDKGYAIYTRLRDAAQRSGGNAGEFTPAQLAAAVKKADTSVGKRATTEGAALMQDLSDAGKSVLPSQVPNSGTADRFFMGMATGGGLAYLEPNALAAAGFASLPFVPGGRQLTAALLAKRPQSFNRLADIVSKSSPAIAIAAPQAVPSR